MKRFDPSVGSSLLTLGVIVAVGVLLSLVTIVPNGSTASNIAAGNGNGATVGPDTGGDTGGTGGGDTSGTGGTGGGTSGQQAKNTTSGNKVNPANLQCAAGKNGGSTDTGVSGSSIKLAATVVADGPGSSFLGPVRLGMTTVVNKINKGGGVCGRQLNLILRNDSWDASTGQRYIQNFVESDKVFALAVVPSSEGLQAADSYIQQQGVPVVGSDGMLKHQYKNPWIWPVATSTVSTMHIMAKNAADRGATNFAIVYDAKYHFGVEGAYAYNQAVIRITGSKVKGFVSPDDKQCDGRYCGIQPQKPSYATEARQFNTECYQTAPRCDFIAFLLEPDTAVSWFREGRDADPSLGADGGFGLAQPLFTRSLAENCRTACDGMWVWTGYNPPIEALASRPGVAKFVNDVHQESATADVDNQFLEGGYLGMSLMVAALQKVGPNVTRANLRSALDSMTFDVGLSSPLAWHPGNHIANSSSQAFAIQYKQAFNGWRQKTGFLTDPWVGQDL